MKLSEKNNRLHGSLLLLFINNFLVRTSSSSEVSGLQGLPSQELGPPRGGIGEVGLAPSQGGPSF